MLTPTPSRPGRSRKRHWLSGAVTLLAALAAVVGLSGLQAPGASASMARVAAAGHPALAVHSSAGHAAAAPQSHAKLKPVIRTAVRHDTSPKMRTVKPSKKVLKAAKKLKALPLRSPPHKISKTAAAARTADVQRSKIVTTDTMPSFGQNFEGVSNLNGVFPPDTNMAVGPNDIVQTVNFSFAVYNKSGGTLLGPETLGTLWQGFGGACDPATDPTAANGGDVVAMYDEQANRFIVTQLAYPQLTIGSGGFHECIAISQTGDPTGAWFRYDFLASNDTLNDYPKLGVWPDAYYMSQNDFPNDGNANQNGVTVTAFDRAQMLAGQQATAVQFTTGSQYANLLPSNTEGAALGVNPPSGAPNPYFMSCDAEAGGPCSSDQMDEWDFHVDWSNPANSTFGNNGDPTTTFPVAAFNSNLCNFDGHCITQPGTSQGLDALSDRLMYQSAYRNLGGGTQAVVLNQTVNVSTSGGNQAGVRWYELTNTGSGWQMGQQGTYAPDTDNRWMGSANIDASGDIAVGYSVSSASTFPSIRVAGRLAGDPAGQLSQGETTLIAGTGSQTGADQFGRGRWGDYSAMQVDPTDACTFWYTTEYMQTTSPDSWQTRVGSFKFPSCTAGPHGTLTGTVTDASNGNPIAGATVSTSTASTTTDSQGHYSMDLPVGSYNVDYSAFGFTPKTESGVQVTDGGTTTQNEALSPSPSVHVTGTVTDGSGHGWPLHASIDITGNPNGPVWTNPATGQYSVSLPANATYALTVNTDLPGYQTVNDSVTVGSGDVTHNISVPVNPACTAPGYHLTNHTPVFSESFDGSTMPPGWTVTDNNGSGQNWQIGDPENRGNLTGGSGNFADINSDFYGPGHTQNTTLTTPAMDLSGVGNPILTFHNDYNGFPNQTGNVDVSTDGGQTWTNIWSHGSDSVRGPILETVHAPQAAGQSSVQFRFHFTSSFGWWWQIDDVAVQDQSCDPTPGGLVVGQVTDANTGKGLDGATVTSTDNPSDKATSALSGDPGIGDGYYWLFSSLTGSHQFTAAKPPYQNDNETVNVAADSATRQDFSLKAAVLSVSPASISSSQVLGTTTTKTLTFKNTGTAPASVQLNELGGSFQLLGATKPPALPPPGAVKFSPTVAPGPTSYTVNRGADGGAMKSKTRALSAPNSPGWQSAAPVPEGLVRYAYATCSDAPNSFYVISGVSNGNVVTTNFRYDASSNSWTTLAPIPTGQEAPSAACLNGKIYVMGGGGTNQMFVYDIASNSWSAGAALPQGTEGAVAGAFNGKVYLIGGDNDFTPGDGVYNTTEVYDIASNSWSTGAPMPTGVSNPGGVQVGQFVYVVGGWGTSAPSSNSTATQRYDMSSGTWTTGPSFTPAKADFALSASGTALYAIGGDANGGGFFDASTSASRLDLSSWPGGTWQDLGDPLPAPRVANSAGFCTTALSGGENWSVGGADSGLVFHNDAFFRTSGEGCAGEDVPWLAESPAQFNVPVGGTVTVTVTLSATTADKVTQPGAYTAGILAISPDTPQGLSPINVTMNVTPPKGWGKIAGVVSGEDCSGKTSPLKSVVFANGKKGSGTQFNLPTDAGGNYAFWDAAGDSPFTLQASANGWIAVTKTASIRGGKTTTVNFTLRPTSC